MGGSSRDRPSHRFQDLEQKISLTDAIADLRAEERPGASGHRQISLIGVAIFNRLIVLVAMAGLAAAPASAHCDGMDGPVVAAAQKALSTGDVDFVLIWVRKADEAEIRRAFVRTLDVRKLGPEARELADDFFFETLVRLHRAGEGAPFTGLKPAGRDLGPAIPAADQALKSGDVAPLDKILVDRVRTRLVDRYQQAVAAKNFQRHDVAAGREYVEAYVTFIHYVEGIYEAATRTIEGHYPENLEDTRPGH